MHNQKVCKFYEVIISWDTNTTISDFEQRSPQEKQWKQNVCVLVQANTDRIHNYIFLPFLCLANFFLRSCLTMHWWNTRRNTSHARTMYQPKFNPAADRKTASTSHKVFLPVLVQIAHRFWPNRIGLSDLLDSFSY